MLVIAEFASAMISRITASHMRSATVPPRPSAMSMTVSVARAMTNGVSRAVAEVATAPMTTVR